MRHEINGFAVEPCTTNRHLFRRLTEPRHAYIFEITAKRIVLRATFPDEGGTGGGDPLEDAERSEQDARNAAQEFQRRTFG
jgi:hypothetical protein